MTCDFDSAGAKSLGILETLLIFFSQSFFCMPWLSTVEASAWNLILSCSSSVSVCRGSETDQTCLQVSQIELGMSSPLSCFSERSLLTTSR